ncbi:nucleoside-diphosphate sugar epimerase [Skermanella stibiiresistens SB22]|uniref:Nucleoside-diphosphate sugar epimerase n=1 Tax=Skermanella stibiiresistens SB22 TaxID=1385369 RepID=W9H5M5_9PROT|nr:SDR family oxidoreductase [Skermanella stibiiresistens]EWY40081.1 nucleoside-diphosphate sugar epimerase [Skermanella stibiiresistens SB22]
MMGDRVKTLMVTGAGGHLGRRVVEILLAGGQGKVIAGSRDPSKLTALAELGAEIRKVDFDDPDLAGTFAGVDRLLIVSTDEIAVPGRRLAQHKAAVDAAVKAGVGHVVYTSMPNPEPGSPIPFAPDHFGTEQALAASGLGWTVLRDSWYAENLLLSLPHVLATGQWFTSAGDGRVAHVTRDDCARAAAAALAAGERGNARYDVTGPEALTTTEIAAIASDVFGRPITVVQVTDEQLAEGMVASGVPAFLAPILVSFDTNTRVGRADLVGDGVKTLTGEDPTSLRDYLTANKAAFLKAV